MKNKRNNQPSVRYAIYAVPNPQSPLALLGSSLLGRDSETGAPVPQSSLWNIPQSMLWELTATPRRYGLHATLKAPFRLKAGFSEADILTCAEQFAAHTSPVSLPKLNVDTIGDFFALVPQRLFMSQQQAYQEALRLASAAVAFFEPLRADLSPHELEKRRRTPLTPRQEALLEKWGYPFVFDNYRFHLTLTGTVNDTKDKLIITQALTRYFSTVLEQPFVIDSICLCKECVSSDNGDEPHSPSASPAEPAFTLLKRFALKGNANLLHRHTTRNSNPAV